MTIMDQIAGTVGEVRSFLEPRFRDCRGERELAEGAPISHFNCFPSAVFLKLVLANRVAEKNWKAVNGTLDHENHSFVTDADESIICDVTGDQFGYGPAVAIPRIGSDYIVRHEIIEEKDLSKPEVKSLISWIQEWRLHEASATLSATIDAEANAARSMAMR